MTAAPALRPYLPSDAPRCAAIFRSSVEEMTGDDYDEDQRSAWAAGADDETAFGARLANGLTLIATVEGEPAGFGSLKDADIIDMLYVDPASSRLGIASLLIDALAKLAASRGAKQLTSEVSDTARATFERQGFIAQRRNLVQLGGQWLANTTMIKPLTATKPAGSPAPNLH